MRHRFISDPQDPFSDPNTGWDDTNFFPASFYPAFHPATGHGGGSPPAPTPLVISLSPTLPAESIQAQAAVSGSGSGGTGSVVAETSSSGFTINLIFDSAAMAAPSSFRAGIEQAASILSATITNKISVNLNIDYSGTGGGAAAGPDNGQYVNYSTVRTDLINNAAPGDTTFNALPNASSIQGQSQVAVWNAQLKLFGLLGATDTTTDDGSATFATDIQSSLLVGVALHELTHALGRVPYGASSNGFAPDIFDFYRFTSPGTNLFSDSIPSSAAYFSVNGGSTKLADFGLYSDPSDFLNAANGALPGPYSNLTPNDAFDELYGSNTVQGLSAVDKQQLDALGFNTIPQGIVVAATASEAIQGGGAVSLLSGAPVINDPASTTLSSATIKIANAGGSAVAGDELFVNGIQNGSVGSGVTASWNATTSTLTLTGDASLAIYDTLLSEVSYQDTGTDTSSGSHPVRTVTWAVNDGTNTFTATSQITIDRVPVVNNEVATDVVGSTFTTTAASGVLSNDTDLDGDRLTVTGVSDAAHGASSVGSSLAGVYGHLTLNADGSYSYVADNSSAINSAPTGSHLQDAFTYTVSDGNGGTASAILAVTLDRPPVVTVANVTLGTGQTSVAATSLFTASDPDGNTITTYGFQDTGSGHFVLNGVAQANNQEIDVTAAQLSQLTYQSAPGSAVDTVEVRVNDGTLWSSWTSFTVTDPLVIQTDGTTSLVQVGNVYELNPVAGGTGPTLKYLGAAVTVGQEVGWTPIGAVQTASGYDVVWKNVSSSLYNVWGTDSSGNYVSTIVGTTSGSSTALESIETVFHQDLNGDGVIGLPPPPPPTVIESFGVTSLVQVGSNYFLNPVAGGSGPELQYNGTAVTVGEFSGWTPIAAEQTASGYDVALENVSSSLYNVWGTDSSGNYVSTIVGTTSGSSTALESIETVFHQDLNGDGVIGIYAAPGTALQINTPLNGTSGSTTIGTGATLELGAADSASVTFSSSTGMLKLDTPSTFSGLIFNFAGNGSLSGSDQIDLKGINFNSVHDTYTGGVLSVSDGTNSAALEFNGSYSLANFKFISDGSGGTIVYDPPVSTSNPAPQSSSTVAAPLNFATANQMAGDTFVFAPNFGHQTINNFDPNHETIQIDHGVFADVTALMAHTSDNSSGNAVIAANAHDTITILGVTTEVLQHHLNDFIIH